MFGRTRQKMVGLTMPIVKVKYECEFCGKLFNRREACEEHEEECLENQEMLLLKDLRCMATDIKPSRYRPDRLLEIAYSELYSIDKEENKKMFKRMLTEEPIPGLYNCATCFKTDGKIYSVECLRAGDYPRFDCPRWEFDMHYNFGCRTSYPAPDFLIRNE
jgi:hypothetical protein